MATTAHRNIEHMERTTVGEASRTDARPANRIVFDSFDAEWRSLVSRKVAIQRKLTETNRRAAKDNLAIRARYDNGPDGAREWLRVKGVIEIEQLRLAKDLHAIESRMQEVKPLLKKERRAKSMRDDPYAEQKQTQIQLLETLVNEVREIKALLLPKE